MDLVVSITRWKTASEFNYLPKETQRTKLIAREAIVRHGAGCVTSFSVTRSWPHAGQPVAPPSGGLAWACMK